MLNGLQLQSLSSSCQIGTLMVESHSRIRKGHRHFETEPSVFKTASSLLLFDMTYFFLKSWRGTKELWGDVFVLSLDCWSPNSWTLLQPLLKVYQPRGQQTMEVRNVYWKPHQPLFCCAVNNLVLRWRRAWLIWFGLVWFRMNRFHLASYFVADLANWLA